MEELVGRQRPLLVPLRKTGGGVTGSATSGAILTCPGGKENASGWLAGDLLGSLSTG